MRVLTQTIALIGFNLRTLPARKGSAAAAIFGIAGVVAVLVGVLSIGQGFRRTMTIAGSPDTVFVAARRGDFDAVVSMYHDQGQIAMKLLGFEQGVTLHGGLPVPVATSASGSAFDIAGKGLAQIEGLQQAFAICCRMAGAVRAGRAGG